VVRDVRRSAFVGGVRLERASRYKADGAKYATYQALWIVTRMDGQWGVQARSRFAP
jgi:hypothetical protein